MKITKFLYALALLALLPFGASAQQEEEPTFEACMSKHASITSINFSDGAMPIATCNSNTGRVELVFPLWKEQMPEILARFRAELKGGYAQAQVAGLLGVGSNDEALACRTHFKEARALVDKAAAAYFFTTEYTNHYPRSMIIGRINGALDEIYQANAIAQRCKNPNPESDFTPARYGEQKRINALRFRRHVTDVVRAAKL